MPSLPMIPLPHVCPLPCKPVGTQFVKPSPMFLWLACGHMPLNSHFGVPTALSSLISKQADTVSFTTLLARQQILLNWKSTQPPSVSAWLTDTMFFLQLEKIKYSLTGSNKINGYKVATIYTVFHCPAKFDEDEELWLKIVVLPLTPCFHHVVWAICNSILLFYSALSFPVFIYFIFSLSVSCLFPYLIWLNSNFATCLVCIQVAPNEWWWNIYFYAHDPGLTFS